MKRLVTVAAIAAMSSGGCKEAPQGQVTVTLQGLPEVEAQVPQGTKVSKNAVGLGVMLKGPGVSMTISSEALESDPATLDEAKKNAEAYKPQNMKTELLPDGFLLTYSSEGNMGTNYWLVGRRNIDDHTFICGVKSPKHEHQQSATAICKSLQR